MMLVCRRSSLLLPLVMACPAVAQGLGPTLGSSDQLKNYNDCMKVARAEPLRGLAAAEKWQAAGGGFGARHCAATALFEAGRYGDAATQFESIARDMGQDRPGLRAELWAQAGQAFMEAGLADRAADMQSRALALKGGDPDLWIDRGLSYAAMRAWPRAISDFDHALGLRPNDVEILVLRAAAWRNSGNAARALEDAARALKIAPDHSEALLERGFASLANGDRRQANDDFNTVLRLVPPGSTAARRAMAGLRGEQPAPPGQESPTPSRKAPGGTGKP
jgi:tetratricopeptide (TPR) repeat protein